MNVITKVDQLEGLRKNEAIIRSGIDTFVGVGKALLEIRNSQQYLADGWSTFGDYCKGVWPNLAQATLYYELDVAKIREVLADNEIVPAHARVMKKVLKDDEELIKETWVEVQANLEPKDITAENVERIAKKQWLQKNSGPLGEAVRLQKITPDKAFALQKVLSKLPDKFTLAVLNFGIGEDCVSGETLRAIQALSYQDSEASDEILSSGLLYKTPLWQLTPQDIQRYQQRLSYEAAQSKILTAIDKQKKVLDRSNAAIFDSVGTWNLENSPMLYFMFTNGIVSKEDLITFITNHELEVFFIAAYDPDNPPMINFGGIGVLPNDVKVKPKTLIDYISNSTL